MLKLSLPEPENSDAVYVNKFEEIASGLYTNFTAELERMCTCFAQTNMSDVNIKLASDRIPRTNVCETCAAPACLTNTSKHQLPLAVGGILEIPRCECSNGQTKSIVPCFS